MRNYLFISVLAVACFFTGHAMESNGNEQFASGDTTTLSSIDKIVEHETEVLKNKKHDQNLSDAWSRNTYLNLSYNTTHKMSSEEFPSTAGLLPKTEYKSKWGFGLEWGRTFNFHRNPLGSVLFIGLDYTWMDLNINKFDKENAPAGYDVGERVRNMPWHNEKMTLGYGMSVGPALTFFPFSSVNSSAANNIRLQFYFHVGYGVEFAIIKDAILESTEIKDGHAFGHGLYTAFGGNLSWKFIGIGYEVRNDNKIKYKVIDKNYDTGKLNIKEETGRLYLQFRF